jgi:hypothetical protein
MIIEPYIIDHHAGPKPCEYSHTTRSTFGPEPPCNAEVILHAGVVERFLCKRHAANELRQEPTLLAQAVIDLYVH